MVDPRKPKAPLKPKSHWTMSDVVQTFDLTAAALWAGLKIFRVAE
jgi:hypothetical protein